MKKTFSSLLSRARGFLLRRQRSSALRKSENRRADIHFQATAWLSVHEAAGFFGPSDTEILETLLPLARSGSIDLSLPGSAIASADFPSAGDGPSDLRFFQTFERETLERCPDFLSFSRLKLPDSVAAAIAQACLDGEALLQAKILESASEPAIGERRVPGRSL